MFGSGSNTKAVNRTNDVAIIQQADIDRYIANAEQMFQMVGEIPKTPQSRMDQKSKWIRTVLLPRLQMLKNLTALDKNLLEKVPTISEWVRLLVKDNGWMSAMTGITANKIQGNPDCISDSEHSLSWNSVKQSARFRTVELAFNMQHRKMQTTELSTTVSGLYQGVLCNMRQRIAEILIEYLDRTEDLQWNPPTIGKGMQLFEAKVVLIESLLLVVVKAECDTSDAIHQKKLQALASEMIDPLTQALCEHSNAETETTGFNEGFFAQALKDFIQNYKKMVLNTHSSGYRFLHALTAVNFRNSRMHILDVLFDSVDAWQKIYCSAPVIEHVEYVSQATANVRSVLERHGIASI